MLKIWSPNTLSQLNAMTSSHPQIPSKINYARQKQIWRKLC